MQFPNLFAVAPSEKMSPLTRDKEAKTHAALSEFASTFMTLGELWQCGPLHREDVEKNMGRLRDDFRRQMCCILKRSGPADHDFESVSDLLLALSAILRSRLVSQQSVNLSTMIPGTHQSIIIHSSIPASLQSLVANKDFTNGGEQVLLLFEVSVFEGAERVPDCIDTQTWKSL